jgi:tetratricopeptide (TPR) repeat protein
MSGTMNRFVLVGLVVIFSFSVYAGSGKDAQQANSSSFRRGNLSVEEVNALELKLKQDPRDDKTRSTLLQHYSMQDAKSEEARKRKQEIILWIIKNEPESRLIQSGWVFMEPHRDNDAYEKGRKLWLKHVKKNPENAKILGNAANYLSLTDRKIAEGLLIKCKILEPRNPKWPNALGHIYILNGMTKNNDKEIKRSAAQKALEQYEEAYNLSKNGESGCPVLGDLAKCSFDAENYEKAKKYAGQMLDEAPKNPKNWNYGNAIHDGNVVLGRIALSEGKIDEAKDYLLKAGSTPGSPQLNSFGPNMNLAKELLEKGEKETVLKYLEECSKFWPTANEFIDAIKKGETPDWAGNLYY